jgi:hypothetical protein
MKSQFETILKHAALGLAFITAGANAQTTGNWGTTATPTTTTNAVGVGTATPGAWQEIEYCDDQQKGLIVTKTNLCPPILTYQATQDGVVMLGDEQPSNVFSVPINFKLVPYNTFQDKPLIWARVQNYSTLGYITSGSHSSRFMVTPQGKTGINIEHPRAALDVKCLGTFNIPAAIFGRQQANTTDRTQHIHIVPYLSENGYNQISQQNDLGIFFTDGLGTDGANSNGAFVLAPWASDRNPAIGGLRINANGSVDVHGELKATKVNVETQWWSDFVFQPTYELMSLSKVEAFIKANKHLPQVPSEEELKKSSLNLGEMQAIHMQKIEELTLYAIEQEKQLTEQKTLLEAQQKQIETLTKQIETLLTTAKQ